MQRDLAQLVELLGVARADDPAVAHRERRIVRDRAREQRRDVLHRIERVGRFADQHRAVGRRVALQKRNHLQRRLQRETVARVQRVVGDAAQQPLDVVDAAQRLAQRVCLERPPDELLDRVEPARNLAGVAQRTLDPAAYKPAAHRGLRAVEYSQERAALPTSARAGQLEVDKRRAVERHEARTLVRLDREYVAERVFLRLGEVRKQRPRGRDAEPPVGEPELRDALPEVRGQRLRRLRVLKQLFPGKSGASRALGRDRKERFPVVCDDLARVEPGELVRERQARVVELEAAEFPGRDVAKGNPGALSVQEHAQYVARAALLEHVGLDDRPGRDDAYDLALDQPLRRRGVGHLLADRDLVPPLDQLCEVHVHRVKRHAAHRRALGEAAIPPGQRQFQLAGDEHGVLEEHLVEVAEAEKQDRVPVPLLHLEVLLHHRRNRHVRHPAFFFCWLFFLFFECQSAYRDCLRAFLCGRPVSARVGSRLRTTSSLRRSRRVRRR
ncbi:MAG: hypothetical protein BWY81_01123 [Firmicutes bacterium ADurb.Bin467]|nr:MAG: hypothetical protein BWY81_01123 [Firmicutes bacterium ADurb.Bin467]